MTRSSCLLAVNRRLAALPTEILVEVLHLLDETHTAICRLVSLLRRGFLRSSLTVRQVCKRFEYIIGHNARLRYPLELAAARYVDGHTEYPARAGTRLELFKAQQEAWRKQDFRKRRTLDSSKYLYTPASSAYRGGVLALGVFNISIVTIPNLTPELTDLLRTIYINELHIFYMWSAGTDEPCRRQHRILDSPFSDFDLEPSQDLLVLWDSTSPNLHGLQYVNIMSVSNASSHSYASMRFLSLREGTPHKRARMSNLYMPIHHFFPENNPPDEFYVFDVNSVQLSGEYALLCANQCRNVAVLNWVTGFHWVSRLFLYVTDVYIRLDQALHRFSPVPPAV